MLFRNAFYQGLFDGSTTLTFRRWARPRVRAGGRYRLNAGHVLEVDVVDLVRPAQITEEEARRAGFPDGAGLLKELSRGAPLAPGDTVYRIAFRTVQLPETEQNLAFNADLSGEEVRALTRRLQQMDARSRHGPWTRATLSLIQRRPRVAASQLAKQLGRETREFKANVRKLKALGLTISFDVGYEVSPRGRVILKRWKS